MFLYGRNGEKLSLECDSCGKAFSYDSNFFSEIFFSRVADSFCISEQEIKCPNCGNTVAPQTKIYSKFNSSSPYSTSTIPDTNKKKSKKTLIIVLIIILIVVIAGISAQCNPVGLWEDTMRQNIEAYDYD